jgi:DNA topoisomerase VI subunit B
MDFFSEKELTTQVGHARSEWAQVICKELIDNSLDACEEADIAPVIRVKANATGITVADNGPGLPESTLRRALDFSVRCSSREMYVAPDRGAQGNALMTLLAMPYVLDPEHGKCIAMTNGVRHEISCRCDPISQRPVVDDHTSSAKQNGAVGTTVRIQWRKQVNDYDEIQWPFEDSDSSWQYWDEEEECDNITNLMYGYAFFNPHLSLTLDWFGKKLRFKATNNNWCKWKPNKPTSPHWYDQQHIERLIAAYITLGRDANTDQTVSDFLTEFEGLSGTKKRREILEQTGTSRVYLSQLVNGDRLDSPRIAKLLKAMKAASTPVIPKRLGVIGKDHFYARFKELDGVMESFQYQRAFHVDGAIPCVIESAFAWRGEQCGDRRRIYAGANWSAVIKDPFRAMGADGLGSLLAKQRSSCDEPIIFALHLAKARAEYKDRGKTEVVIDE